MKLFTLMLLFAASTATAQWSDTKNFFADSLHMNVCNAAKNQDASIIVRSYPDSGYFVIWQDHRNDPTSYDDIAAIYAQKYNKAGKALWKTNGVPASSSTNNQHYIISSSRDYHDYSYAATDSAGGFYIAYADDSVTNYNYERVCVQHYKSDGSTVFGGPGHVIYSSVSGGAAVSPQLVADGNGGFFISYIQSVNGYNSSTPDKLFAYCYKDVNGTLQFYGGGQVNQNAIQTINSSPCGNYSDITYSVAEIGDYNIFSDLQGGCNIVMTLSVNGEVGPILGYNKLYRAKQNATATQYYLDESFNRMPETQNYQQGNVYLLYALRTDHQTITCGSNPNVYVITQNRLLQNGFLEIDGGANLYDFNDPIGVTVSTAGNINASFLAVSERTYSQANGVSRRFVNGYVVKEEKFDSIPYQRATDITYATASYPGYNNIEPTGINTLNNFRDILLWSPSNYDFSLSGGGNQIFSSEVQDSVGIVRLQHLAVETQSADSFAVVYKTDVKQGAIIGKGHYGAPPLITVNKNGNALFYVAEYSSGGSSANIHVSPIFNGAQLAWGAMGEKIGEDYNDFGSPSVLLDPVNGTGLISWTDLRNQATSGYDIYMRHLDSLNNPDYQPPYTTVKFAPDPYGPVNSSATLYGTSNKLTSFEINDDGPAVAISDNYNLGNVNVGVYDYNGGAVRTYNGAPYLDRSWTITPDNNPNGAANVAIRLFFTTAEFNALKAADPSIKSPGDLAVVKQPSGSGSTYTVVAGEKTVLPQSWDSVAGGYYIQIQVTSFSNFFIFKNENALPVKWLGVQAQWQNSKQAKVTWQVAEQQNTQSYTVQYSSNGISFTDATTVPANTAETQYSCIVAAGNETNYYRVIETDNDGRKNYSEIVRLQATVQSEVAIHPNPVKDVLYVKGLDNYKSIQITDENGKIYLQQNVESATQSINVSHLAPGVYMLTLKGSNQTKTFKFIKM
jgi:hypothetical protein